MANAVENKPEQASGAANDLWLQGLKDKYGNSSDAKLARGESPGNIRSEKPKGGNAPGSGSGSSSNKPGQPSPLGKAGNLLKGANAARQAAANPRQAAGELAKQAAKKAVKYAARAAAKGLDAATAGAASLIERALENRRVRAVLKWLIIAAAILIFILIAAFAAPFLVFLTNQANSTKNSGANSTYQLTINLEGPSSVSGNNYDYKISYSFPLSGQDLVITDTIPSNVNYISSPAKINYDSATRKLTWKLSDNLPKPAGGVYSSSDMTGSFSFTVKPIGTDTHIYNLGATGNVIGAILDGGTTGGTGPVANDCNGAYRSIFNQNLDTTSDPARKIFIHKTAPNFGDPSCSLSNFGQHVTDPQSVDNLFQWIKANDANNFGTWISIIQCESGYDANNFNPHSESTLGAYGLVQMNPQYFPDANGNPTTLRATGALIYDVGDTDWKAQITNAIKYNQGLTCKWRYWGCAPSKLTSVCTP